MLFLVQYFDSGTCKESGLCENLPQTPMYIKLAYGALGLTIAVAILSAIDLFKLVLYKKIFKKNRIRRVKYVVQGFVRSPQYLLSLVLCFHF